MTPEGRFRGSPFAVAFGGAVPPVLVDLAAAIEPEVGRVARLVLDEADVRLYGEARERVVADAKRDAVRHVLWAVVEAVRRELMRPEPVPFTPPRAGSWIRGRWTQDERWYGKWHVFSGDLRTWPHAVNVVHGTTRCGVRITLRSAVAEAVVADKPPALDACRRCSGERDEVRRRRRALAVVR